MSSPESPRLSDHHLKENEVESSVTKNAWFKYFGMAKELIALEVTGVRRIKATEEGNGKAENLGNRSGYNW